MWSRGTDDERQISFFACFYHTTRIAARLNTRFVSLSLFYAKVQIQNDKSHVILGGKKVSYEVNFVLAG